MSPLAAFALGVVCCLLAECLLVCVLAMLLWSGARRVAESLATPAPASFGAVDHQRRLAALAARTRQTPWPAVKES